MDKSKKQYKIIYFTGNFFSAAGEQMHTAIITARSEEEAEKIFERRKSYTYKGGHLAAIEEVTR